MKVGIFLFLTTICLANNVAEGVLKDEVTSHYSIPINKPQAGAKILKGPKKKALAKAKAARAESQGFLCRFYSGHGFIDLSASDQLNRNTSDH